MLKEGNRLTTLSHWASRGNCECAFVVALALLTAVTPTHFGGFHILIASANTRSGAALMRRSPGINASLSNAPVDRRSIGMPVHKPFAARAAPGVRETATIEAPLMSAAFEMLIPSGEDAPMMTTRRPERSVFTLPPAAADSGSARVLLKLD